MNSGKVELTKEEKESVLNWLKKKHLKCQWIVQGNMYRLEMKDKNGNRVIEKIGTLEDINTINYNQLKALLILMKKRLEECANG